MKPHDIRILAIVPGDRFSGPAGQVASTGPELARLGVDLRFVVLDRPGASSGQLPAFLKRWNIAHAIVPDHGPLDLALPGRVRSILDEWRPAVVETHGYKASAIAFRLGRDRPEWRWIGYFHGFTTESRRAGFYHWLDLRMLRRADVVVAVSEAQRHELARTIRDVRVIRNAVTLLDDPGDVPPDWLDGVTRLTPPRLAVVGRLSPEKGVDVFLQALARLQARGVRCSALIAGDGPERTALERDASSLGLDDRVRFLGHVAHVRPLYARIDLLVIPSRSEGLPSVLLEALAADVAVVSTRVGSIPDVLTAEGAGILVPPDSPSALADGIEAGLAIRHSPVARQARASAAAAYSQEKRAQALVSLYLELTGDASRRRPA
ncbi:MAG: glycosyltransferase [Gemmatimonadetes bacterium]|nr:glycosyltransferase [Gemmatimonadota bacterium]